MNDKIKILTDLLSPSAIGAVMYTAFSGLLIALHQFRDIKELLQLPADFSLARAVMGWLDGMLTGMLGQSMAETAVVGAFWAVVGLGVYVLLQGAARFFTEIGSGLDARGYAWPKEASRNRLLVEAVQRNIFRLAAGSALVLMLVGPMARIISGPVWVGRIGQGGALQLTVWFAVCWVVLHLCVILARLAALKPRLFG